MINETIVEMIRGEVPEQVRNACKVFGCPETLAMMICILDHYPISNEKLMSTFKISQAYLWSVIKPLGRYGMVEQATWEGKVLYRPTAMGKAMFTAIFSAVLPELYEWEAVRP